MTSSSSDLVNNLAERIHRIKCKYKHDNKNVKLIKFKDDLIEYKCLCCNKNYQRKFDESFEKRFFNTYKFF